MPNFFQRLAARMKEIELAQREKSSAKVQQVRDTLTTRKKVREEIKNKKLAAEAKGSSAKNSAGKGKRRK